MRRASPESADLTASPAGPARKPENRFRRPARPRAAGDRRGTTGGGSAASGAALCTLNPGETLALVRVERDTTLPYVPISRQMLVRLTGRDQMPPYQVPDTTGPRLAMPWTPMPAGRVRLLHVDSATRSILAAHGITAEQPTAFLRAEPYDQSYATVRWVGPDAFVERGEIGFVRGLLLPREQWVDGVPLIIVRNPSRYPYPRRRGLVSHVAPDAPLAPAEALFEISTILQTPRRVVEAGFVTADSAKRERVIAWARANAAAAELEPLRTLVRRAVVETDLEVARRMPSRLRGTYRVTVETGGERAAWYFRTYDRGSFRWDGADWPATTAELPASPYSPGYRLVGYAAFSQDSLPAPKLTGRRSPPLVWLAVGDRPTAPGNGARRTLRGLLEFVLAAAPAPVSGALEPLVPPPASAHAARPAARGESIRRERKQPCIPLTIRLDVQGGIRANTLLTAGGRHLRVVLERVDTLTLGPF